MLCKKLLKLGLMGGKAVELHMHREKHKVADRTRLDSFTDFSSISESSSDHNISYSNRPKDYLWVYRYPSDRGTVFSALRNKTQIPQH